MIVNLLISTSPEDVFFYHGDPRPPPGRGANNNPAQGPTFASIKCNDQISAK